MNHFIKSTYTIVTIALIFLCSSCATIFNSAYTSTTIHTIPENARIILNKKDTFCCNTKLYSVKRSGYPLEIKLKNDSLEKTIIVDPLKSSTYVFANILNGWIYGGGYLIDLASRKRFTYPNDIYINLYKKDKVPGLYTKAGRIVERKAEADNQLVNFVLHVPTINSYSFSIANQIYYNVTSPPGVVPTIKNDTVGGTQSIAGWLGFSGSVEYYLSKNYYLSGNLGYYPKFGIFLYSAPNRDYSYMSLSINRRLNRFHLGAGLAWSRFHYTNDPGSDNSDPYGYVNTHGYTLRFEAQYQLSNNWYLATNIQPLIAKDGGSDNNSLNFWGLEFNYKIPVETKMRTVLPYQ